MAQTPMLKPLMAKSSVHGKSATTVGRGHAGSMRSFSSSGRKRWTQHGWYGPWTWPVRKKAEEGLPREGITSRDPAHCFGAEDFAIVEPLRRSGAALMLLVLLHFQFDTANPPSDKIVNGGADDTADESHHAVDHGIKIPIPNMIPATAAAGAVDEASVALGMLRDTPAAAASIKIGRKIKPRQA